MLTIQMRRISALLMLFGLLAFSASAQQNDVVEVEITGLEKTTRVVIYGDGWTNQDTLWIGILKKWQTKKIKLKPRQELLITSKDAVKIKHPAGFQLNTKRAIVSTDLLNMRDPSQCVNLTVYIEDAAWVSLEDYLQHLSAPSLNPELTNGTETEVIKSEDGKMYMVISKMFDPGAGGYLLTMQMFQQLDNGKVATLTATPLSFNECEDCSSCQSLERVAWSNYLNKVVATFEAL